MRCDMQNILFSFTVKTMLFEIFGKALQFYMAFQLIFSQTKVRVNVSSRVCNGSRLRTKVFLS